MEPAPPPPPPTLDDVNAIPEPPKTTITTEEPGKVQYHDKRLMVMFFDFSSMGIPEQLRAQEAALKFIDTEISTADLVAIMLYSPVRPGEDRFHRRPHAVEGHHQCVCRSAS